MQDNYTNELLELKDEKIIITKIYKENKMRHINLKLKKVEHRCPNCGCKTKLVHDYRERKIKHQCSMGYHDILHYLRRRYVCPNCNTKFAEKNNFVAKYSKISFHTKKTNHT